MFSTGSDLFPFHGTGPCRTRSSSGVTSTHVLFRKPAMTEYVSPTPTATWQMGNRKNIHPIAPPGPPPFRPIEYQKTRNASQAIQKNSTKNSNGENQR